MNKRQRERVKSLVPGGVPRHIRVYDNGGPGVFLRRRPGDDGQREGSIDRYTVVYTGRYRHKTGGESRYVGMSGAPFHPQGFCQHGGSADPIDWPTYGHLGKKITYADLPEDCKLAALSDYLYLWDLPGVDEDGYLLPDWAAQLQAAGV